MTFGRAGKILVLFLIGLPGCQQARPVPQAMVDAPAPLRGQPSWLPIGPEVYQERDVSEVETAVLTLRAEPRWFIGFARAVSREEYMAALARERDDGVLRKVEEPAMGGYFLAAPPTYPYSALELPAESDGVTLLLSVQSGDDAAKLSFCLQLNSREKDLSREVQHRWTNALPFLFAFYLDGEAVRCGQDSFSKEGGLAWFMPLVKRGETRTWNVKVDASSIKSVLARATSDQRPHRLSVIAAYGNSQHQEYFDGGHHLELINKVYEKDNLPTMMIVRSNVASLTWDGQRWRSR